MTSNHEPFVEVLDGEARLKILASMLDTHQRDISITQISERSGVARSTIYEHIDELVKLELIHETRVMGTSQMYQINSQNPVFDVIKSLNVRCADLLEQCPEP